MNRRISIVVCAMAAVIAGCGQSPEIRLRNAEVAISRGKSEKALELVTKVLAAQPKNADALFIKAKAQLMLRRLDQGRATLEDLISRQSDNTEARLALIDWAFLQAGQMLDKTDFLKNPSYQEKFTEALDVAGSQADWLAIAEGQAAKAQYLNARLRQQEIARIDLMLDDHRQSLRREIDDDRENERVDQLIRRLELDQKKLTKQVEQFLREAIALEPNHHRANERYAESLLDREAWPDLWQLAQRLGQQTDLPASLVDTMVVALLKMPTSAHPRDARLEIASKIVDAAGESQQTRIEWLIAKGRLLLVYEEYEQAKTRLDEALSIKADHVNGRYLLAQALMGLEQYDQVKQILDKLETQVPRSDEVLTLHAKVLHKTGNNSLAKTKLTLAIQLNPDNQLGHQLLFEIMASEDTGLEQAGDEILEYYEDNRASPRAIRVMVQYLQTQGRSKELKRRLDEEVRSIRPLRAEHFVILLDGYFFLKEYELAHQFAKRLVQAKPDNLEAHLRLAEAMLMLNEDKQVKQKLLELQEKFPGATDVEHMLARLYMRRRSFDRAAELLETVLEKQPNDQQARLLLARALANQSLVDEALEHIEKVLEEQPDHVGAHALAARIFHFTGQEDKAKEHLDQINPEAVDEYQHPALAAQILINQDELDKAADICNRAIGVGNADPGLRLMLAGIYARQKKADQAEQQLLALVRSQPDSAQAYALLTRFYIGHGRWERGIDELQKLQTITGNETLSRLSKAQLMMAAKKYPEALRTLEVIYGPLIRQTDRLAMLVADAMSKVLLVQKQRQDARAVYDKLVEANFLASEARLRQIDLQIADRDRETAVRQLDALAGSLGSSQRRLRYMVMRRFASLGEAEKAMRMLRAWIDEEGPKPALLRWRGDLLLQMRRPQDAEAAYLDAIEVAPDSIMLRQRLARAHLAQLDYPSAESAFDEMAAVDPGARIRAFAAKGRMFLRLGLTKQALNTFDELEKIGRPKDPRVIYAIGQAFAEMGRTEQARGRLQEIPSYAQQYASAQLLLARMEQGQGKTEQAKQRLENLLRTRNQRLKDVVVRELLALNIRDEQEETLLSWAERVLSHRDLAPGLKGRWLSVTVQISTKRQDWEDALEALEELKTLLPDEPLFSVQQMVVLLHLNRREQAAMTYRSSRKLAQLSIGPLAAMLVGQTAAPGGAKEPKISVYLRSLVSGDIAGARRAAQSMSPRKTLYANDLMAILERDDVQGPLVVKAAQGTSLALLALESRLYHLSKRLCERVMAGDGQFVPAYGVLVQAQLRLGESVEQTLTLARRNLPQASLGMFLAARSKVAQSDWAGAAEDLRRLLDREPDNFHIEYDLAQMLQNAKASDEAIGVLERLSSRNNPYKILASNDLAYLLAQHRPQRLQEAYDLAKSAQKQDARNAALLDTIGWIEHLRGDNEAALAELCRAVALLGQVKDVHFHLGTVYRSLGNEQWAQYHLAESQGPDKERSSSAAAEAVLHN